ncbi:FG-GAP-like repeat-containing protein [Rufibacter latericius]|uniref:T9SS C-terminal target domain-containing protein n=1 Tax=Rufibacter latericius TaxID=2487040 RepID=A0A3M9MTF8_9BACT|nr:FG-GAP-like repeat-containing protein [Rufibacter latericius]RNI28806.1 T9SS C-terminal target domain-containing protein [Rufibacter latericius]
MKKYLPFLFCLGLLSQQEEASAQSFTIKNLNFGAQHGEVSAIDIDRDGDMDLLIMGETSATDRVVQLFLNDGAGNFTKTASPFLAGAFSSIDWGDVDNDGRLDLLQSGFGAAGAFTALFKSNAAGVFTQVTNPGIQQVNPGTGMADLNNDGYTDIYAFGNADNSPNDASRAKIYFNNKAGGFTESAQFNDYQFIDPEISVVDFDKDGDLDLFVNGFEKVSGSRFSKMFVNTDGTFAVRDLGLIQKGFGGAVWGDYDADGDLDLLLNGDGGANGEASNDIYRLYKNTAGAFAEATTFSTFRQIAVGDGSRFADWDNDGDLDVIVTGWDDTAKRQATAIFLNNAGTFTAMANNDKLPGVSESSIEVADVDGDSDLDLMLTGFSGNEFNGAGSAYNDKVSVVVVNPTTMVNAAPAMPATLQATMGTGGAVTLTWSPATDATTSANSLSYNIFLQDAAGKTYIHPMADTTTGKLMVQKMGNVQLSTSWTIKDLPQGRYRYGVQAIDNSFMGSPFMKTSFTITNGVLTGIADHKLDLQMEVYPNPAPGKINVKLEKGRKYQLKVSSLDGRLVKDLSAMNSVQLSLNPGIYILQVNDGKGGLETRKIVVQ